MHDPRLTVKVTIAYFRHWDVPDSGVFVTSQRATLIVPTRTLLRPAGTWVWQTDRRNAEYVVDVYSVYSLFTVLVSVW